MAQEDELFAFDLPGTFSELFSNVVMIELQSFLPVNHSIIHDLPENIFLK